LAGRAVRSELTTWKATEAVSETTAIENCDLLLVPDEIAQLDAGRGTGGKNECATSFSTSVWLNHRAFAMVVLVFGDESDGFLHNYLYTH
jgi:hypothetical protein